MKPAARRVRLWPSILVSMTVFAVLTLVAFKPSPADRGEFSGVLRAILVGHLQQANTGSVNSHTPPGFALLAAALLWPFGTSPPAGAVNVVGVAMMGILILAALELSQGLGIRLTNRTSLYVLLPIVVTPAAIGSVDDFFHPQDLLATALVVLGIALVVRQRPVAAGVVLGLAVLTKQWAVLAVIPIVFTRRTSGAARMVLVSSIAFGIGIAPFLLTDGPGTIKVLAARTVNRSEVAPIGHLGLSPHFLDAFARLGPPALAVVLALVARARNGATSNVEPRQLVALCTACVATRLVCDPALFLYYFVPASVLLVILESSYGRPPIMASAWIAVTTDMWYGPGKGGAVFAVEVAILFLLMMGAIAVPASIALIAPPGGRGITPFRFARPAAGWSRRSSRSRRRS